MHGWFLIQTFYHGLKCTSREHLDAATGGAFFSLQVPAAKELIEKMVANQGWDGNCLQPRTHGVHQVDGINIIAAKMDLLMKKLEASSNLEAAKMMDLHMMCKVCGNVGHSGNDCLEPRGEASFIYNGNNNGFRNNYNNQVSNSRPNFPFNNQNGGNYSNSFNNQPSSKDLVFGQARINESLNKKLASNEKVLENLNSTIESFTSAMKNQLSFNKMIETQLAQLAASLPSSESGGIPGQPEPTQEHVSAISTGWGKPSRGMYAPNHVGKPIHQIQDPWDESTILQKKDSGYLGITCTIYHQKIKNALCFLGASVNLMPKAMFDELGYPAISPTTMTVQLADSSIKYSEGIVERLLVNVRGSFVFADFVVLDTQEEIPLILGRPFLRDVNATIDVGAGKIQFRIGRRNMTFRFQANEEQCYLVQDEEARGWRKPQPQHKKEKVAPTKVKAFNG
jgi:uncharacterized coiled-coil protein SlyX